MKSPVFDPKALQSKKYVDFYYFWLLQYYLRLKTRVIMEKRRQMIGKLQKMTKHVKPLLSETAKEVLLVRPGDMYSNCLSVSIEGLDTIPDYISSPCSIRDWCINSSCDVKEQVISIIDNYNYNKFPNLNVKNSNLELIYRKDHELFADDLIYIVLNKGGLTFFFRNSGYVEREAKNYGMEVLGFQNVFMANDGTLGGKMLITLDLSSPTPFLMHEIQTLKTHKFQKDPDFSDVTGLTFIEEPDYTLEKSLIESVEGVHTIPEEEKERAIGLWLYDVIDATGRFASVDEAFQAMKDGVWSKEAEATTPEEKQVFKFPLAALGHGNSGPDLFTILHANTQKCIEACEVLQITDTK